MRLWERAMIGGVEKAIVEVDRIGAGNFVVESGRCGRVGRKHRATLQFMWGSGLGVGAGVRR